MIPPNPPRYPPNMTATTTPLDAVRSGYAAFARGDVPAVLGLLDPRVEGTEAAGFPYPGTFVGPEAVLHGVFMKLGTEWEGWSAVLQPFITSVRFRQHTDTVLVRAAMQA